jgi:hypothetical protein
MAAGATDAPDCDEALCDSPVDLTVRQVPLRWALVLGYSDGDVRSCCIH